MNIEEFHKLRQPFYIDGDTLNVKFPTSQKYRDCSHAEWFSDIGYPYCHTIRGYYMETEEPYLMIYWNDFEIPNVTILLVPYLFEYFPKVKWIGLGCDKGNIGEIWNPKLKIIKNDKI